MHKYYYQIDYIDQWDKANYINTFHSMDEALKNHTILQNALNCITDTSSLKNYKNFVLDLYRYDIDENKNAIDDTDEILITIKNGNSFDKVKIFNILFREAENELLNNNIENANYLKSEASIIFHLLNDKEIQTK